MDIYLGNSGSVGDGRYAVSCTDSPKVTLFTQCLECALGSEDGKCWVCMHYKLQSGFFPPDFLSQLGKCEGCLLILGFKHAKI